MAPVRRRFPDLARRAEGGNLTERLRTRNHASGGESAEKRLGIESFFAKVYRYKSMGYAIFPLDSGARWGIL
jgi:hypothetical protein